MFNKDTFQACGAGGCGGAQKSGGGGGADEAAKGGGGGAEKSGGGGGGGFLKKLLGLLGKAPDFLNKIMPLVQQFAGLFGGAK